MKTIAGAILLLAVAIFAADVVAANEQSILFGIP